MAHDVFIPKTGLYMDDVHLLEWLVDEGGAVQEGDILFRMETNKVEQDVEAEASGLLHRQGQPGTEYAIGTVIGWIVADADEYQALIAHGDVT